MLKVKPIMPNFVISKLYKLSFIYLNISVFIKSILVIFCLTQLINNANSRDLYFNAGETASQGFQFTNVRISNEHDYGNMSYTSIDDPGWPRFKVFNERYQNVELTNNYGDVLNVNIITSYIKIILTSKSLSKAAAENFGILDEFTGMNCGTSAIIPQTDEKTEYIITNFDGNENMDCYLPISAKDSYYDTTRDSPYIMEILHYGTVNVEPDERVKARGGIYNGPINYSIYNCWQESNFFSSASEMCFMAVNAVSPLYVSPVGGYYSNIIVNMPEYTTLTTTLNKMRLVDTKSQYIMNGVAPSTLEGEVDFRYTSNIDNKWSLSCEYSIADNCAISSDDGDLLPFNIQIDLPQSHKTDLGENRDIDLTLNQDIYVQINTSYNGNGGSEELNKYKGNGKIKMSTLPGQSERVYKDHPGTSYQGKVFITVDAYVK
ncbi:hypothetical protein [Shewanella japonica]|uniref:hypothetical protein n=1 Tax=Shewanella japonica TaxID=93973 RepID=UPI002494A6C6|nr:hypothetical protein [Shewanella japonica]